MTIGNRLRKVAVIGVGMVGATFAYALTIKGLAEELVLIDLDADRASGEAMDLRHGLSFTTPMRIVSGGYELCRDADIVVITAGAAQKPGQTRLELADRNAGIVEQVVESVLACHPDPIFLVATNPVDILTYLVWKKSGFPPARVIGSGTILDSSRFRYRLSTECGLDPRNVHAHVIGEHGDSEVMLWSQVHLAGIPLVDYCQQFPAICRPDQRKSIEDDVRRAAYDIISRKGSTYYAIGLSLTRIIEALIRDQKSVLTVSTLMDDYYGLNDVCLSLPCVIGSGGVEEILRLRLPDDEQEALRRSAKTIRDTIERIRPQYTR